MRCLVALFLLLAACSSGAPPAPDLSIDPSLADMTRLCPTGTLTLQIMFGTVANGSYVKVDVRAASGGGHAAMTYQHHAGDPLQVVTLDCPACTGMATVSIYTDGGGGASGAATVSFAGPCPSLPFSSWATDF